METIPADAALRQLRQAIYQDVLGRRKDTLFALLDAVSSAPGPLPLVHHSLSPLCPPGWASLPKALTHGTLAVAAARRLLVGHLPRLPPGQRPLWVIDATTWPRPDAVTSPARTWSHRANRGLPSMGSSRAGSTSGCVRCPCPRAVGCCRWMSPGAAPPDLPQRRWR